MCLKKFVAFLFCAFIFSDLSAQDYWQYSSSAKKSIAQTESNPKGVKSIYLNIEAFRTASQRSAKGYEGKTILYFPNEKDNFESFLLTETNVASNFSFSPIKSNIISQILWLSLLVNINGFTRPNTSKYNFGFTNKQPSKFFSIWWIAAILFF